MRQRRLIVLGFRLHYVAGHHLNEALGLYRAALALGMAPTVYAMTKAVPAVTEHLPVERLLPYDLIEEIPAEQLLERLPFSSTSLEAAWQHILQGGLSGEDIVLFTYGLPMALYDLADRINSLPPQSRPAVFIRFLGGEFRNADNGDFCKEAAVQRLIADRLARAAGQERVFYTVNNERELGSLTRLCRRRVFLMPLHKYYGPVPARPPRPANPAGGRTIYIHVPAAGPMERLACEVAEAVLAGNSEVRLILKSCLYGQRQMDDAHYARLPADRVRVVLSEQTPEDYLAMVASADMVVMPYSSRYRFVTSGVFCEAAAFGAVVVVPADSWMAHQIAGGLASGVGFATPTVKDISVAIEKALADWSELEEAARHRAPLARSRHSCAASLARMLELADVPPPLMQVDSAVNDTIDFTTYLGSRSFLHSGWSQTEKGFGVWSDGDQATLVFNLAGPINGPIKVEADVLPFLTDRHRQLSVAVAANGAAICSWEFRQESVETIRSVLIPTGVAGNGALRLDFAFAKPASPAELGLSPDTRHLGFALKSLRLGQTV